MSPISPSRCPPPRRRPLAAAAACLLATASLARAETPPGVEQIIPRGFLAAISEPVFVPGADAGMPDDAWILGVAIGDEAHAYDLNLLNHHEVVNDVVGGRPIAAVW